LKWASLYAKKGPVRGCCYKKPVRREAQKEEMFSDHGCCRKVENYKRPVD